MDLEVSQSGDVANVGGRPSDSLRDVQPSSPNKREAFAGAGAGGQGEASLLGWVRDSVSSGVPESAMETPAPAPFTLFRGRDDPPAPVQDSSPGQSWTSLLRSNLLPSFGQDTAENAEHGAAQVHGPGDVDSKEGHQETGGVTTGVSASKNQPTSVEIAEQHQGSVVEVDADRRLTDGEQLEVGDDGRTSSLCYIGIGPKVDWSLIKRTTCRIADGHAQMQFSSSQDSVHVHGRQDPTGATDTSQDSAHVHGWEVDSKEGHQETAVGTTEVPETQTSIGLVKNDQSEEQAQHQSSTIEVKADHPTREKPQVPVGNENPNLLPVGRDEKGVL